MYKTILVTLDATATDRAIIDHVRALAKALRSRVVLLHVATGVPAQVHGDDAGGKEVKEDSEYLETVRAEFDAAGIRTDTKLAFGNPVIEIIKAAEKSGCDLIAMTAHGHRWLGDLVRGSTIEPVRHKTTIPLLIVRGPA